jgi:DNA (cytosine-5)-methyltransferase 1
VLTHVSLFSGIGGNELAAQWAGFQTVLMCEIDPFCRAVLRKHFPGIPIIEDVHDVTYAKLSGLQAVGAELQTAGASRISSQPSPDTEGGQSGEPQAGNGRESIERASEVNRNAEGNRSGSFGQIQGRKNAIAGRVCGGIRNPQIALLTAGVPCQPASTAGRRRGKNDNRWLWPEAIRVLTELQPAWAVFENPAGIISLDEFGSIADLEGEIPNNVPDEYSGGLDEIIGQIEQAGYEVQTVLIPACAIGAFHRRDRVFVIAHAIDLQRQSGRTPKGEWELANKNQAGNVAPHSERTGLEGAIPTGGICPGRLLAELPDWAGGEMGQPSPLTEFASDTEGKCSQSKQSILPSGDIQGESGGSNSKGQSNEEREIECEFRILPDGLSERLVRPVRNRVSQLKAYGNAVVPEQVYPIFKAIADIEGGRRKQ